MTKQELATKIWQVANDLRGSIAASKYKDYILAIMFYKYLSEAEIKILIEENDFSYETIEEYVNEGQEYVVEICKKRLGYFISYENLFSTWLNNPEFSITNIRDALSAFERNVLVNNNELNVKLFKDIFTTLSSGLSLLGDSTGKQTEHAKKLIRVINEIPMQEKQDYDTIGFVYEYLLANFAANAGKDGEFYTPHEVSKLMAEIVAEHLKDKEQISVLDPTSGSASLLITIGDAIKNRYNDHTKIKYYAQDSNADAYNLTRMNLVMHDILPSNIEVNKGDTLGEVDWPAYDEENNIDISDRLKVDAVVSNPPYSAKWNITDRELDARFRDYGVAPQNKADYAFLLYDLSHIKEDNEGIVAILLPHGVLFRGGQELDIRKNLIEKNKIDTIIGLPANLFYGTGIPVCLIILKHRDIEHNDVLIIDASKDFIKVGKQNKLRESDVKRIFDTYKERKTIPYYSKVVSKEEIRKNDYNLNIPRYVESESNNDIHDLYANMFGGIPNNEIDSFNHYFSEFKNLRNLLFKENSNNNSSLITENIEETIKNSDDIKNFKNEYNKKFADFGDLLKDVLINNALEIAIKSTKKDVVNFNQYKEDIINEVFKKIENYQLIDKYDAYEHVVNTLNQILVDLEIIYHDGKEALTAIKDITETKIIGDKIVEKVVAQDGLIFPVSLIEDIYFKNEKIKLDDLNNEINELNSKIDEIVESIDSESNVKEDDKIDYKKVKEELNKGLENITLPEITILNNYLTLNKNEKINYIKAHNEIKWNEIGQNNNFSKTDINNYINKLKIEYVKENNEEYNNYFNLLEYNNDLKELNKKYKNIELEITKLALEKIKSLSIDEINDLLNYKWIYPILKVINELPDLIVSQLIKGIKKLTKKYSVTLSDINKEISKINNELIQMLDELTGSEIDMLAINEFKSMLKGEL